MGKSPLVTHTRSYRIVETGELQNVLFVPDFQYNFLSVSKLSRELYYFLSFHPGFYLFQDLTTRKLKGIGRKHDGLYLLVPPDSQKSESTQRIDAKEFTTMIKKGTLCCGIEDWLML